MLVMFTPEYTMVANFFILFMHVSFWWREKKTEARTRFILSKKKIYIPGQMQLDHGLVGDFSTEENPPLYT